MSNAVEFISAYNTIDSRLRAIYRGKGSLNFSDLVRRCAEFNKTVRRYEDDLLLCARLRNVIVHESKKNRIIAEPCDDLTRLICHVAELLSSPPKLSALREKNVTGIDADATLADALVVGGRGRGETLAGVRDGTGHGEAAHDDAGEDHADEQDVADDRAEEREQRPREGAADVAARRARDLGVEDGLGARRGSGRVERDHGEDGDDDKTQAERYATGQPLLAVDEEGAREGEDGARDEGGRYAEGEREEVADGARDDGRGGDEKRREQGAGDDDENDADDVTADGSDEHARARARGRGAGARLGAALFCCV